MKRDPRLLAPGVYGFMVHGGGLPDLSLTLARAIMRSWNVDLETIKRLAICGYPSRVENIVIAQECALRYGDLSTVPGFYLHDGCWFLDLDEDRSETGFLLPTIHKQYGFINGLMVFRDARDRRPFPLRVRQERKVAA